MQIESLFLLASLKFSKIDRARERGVLQVFTVALRVSLYATSVAHNDMEDEMAEGRFVAYYRVSTDQQGRSGLGLEAQRKAIASFIDGGGWKLVGEEEEIESGGRSDRPALERAIALCRAHRATLVVAKLDRLARDAHFLFGLEKAGVEFVAVDMPSANRMTVGIMAMVAEEERRLISARTKAALAAAKERGTKLGGFRGRAGTADDTAKARAVRSRKALEHAEALRPILSGIDPDGNCSLRAIADSLNEAEVPTASGRGIWSAASVLRVRSKL